LPFGVAVCDGRSNGGCYRRSRLGASAYRIKLDGNFIVKLIEQVRVKRGNRAHYRGKALQVGQGTVIVAGNALDGGKLDACVDDRERVTGPGLAHRLNVKPRCFVKLPSRLVNGCKRLNSSRRVKIAKHSGGFVEVALPLDDKSTVIIGGALGGRERDGR
jgi:hypothetical protein